MRNRDYEEDRSRYEMIGQPKNRRTHEQQIKEGTMVRLTGYVPNSPRMIVRAQVNSIVKGENITYHATVHEGPLQLRRQISFLHSDVVINGKYISGKPENFKPQGGTA